MTDSAGRYRDPRVGEDVLRCVSSLNIDLQHLSDQLLQQQQKAFRKTLQFGQQQAKIWVLNIFHTLKGKLWQSDDHIRLIWSKVRYIMAANRAQSITA